MIVEGVNGVWRISADFFLQSSFVPHSYLKVGLGKILVGSDRPLHVFNNEASEARDQSMLTCENFASAGEVGGDRYDGMVRRGGILQLSLKAIDKGFFLL